jgi:hypothetical protein
MHNTLKRQTTRNTYLDMYYGPRKSNIGAVWGGVRQSNVSVWWANKEKDNDRSGKKK